MGHLQTAVVNPLPLLVGGHSRTVERALGQVLGSLGYRVRMIDEYLPGLGNFGSFHHAWPAYRTELLGSRALIWVPVNGGSPAESCIDPVRLFLLQKLEGCVQNLPCLIVSLSKGGASPPNVAVLGQEVIDLDLVLLVSHIEGNGRHPECGAIIPNSVCGVFYRAALSNLVHAFKNLEPFRISYVKAYGSGLLMLLERVLRHCELLKLSSEAECCIESIWVIQEGLLSSAKAMRRVQRMWNEANEQCQTAFYSKYIQALQDVKTGAIASGSDNREKVRA